MRWASSHSEGVGRRKEGKGVSIRLFEWDCSFFSRNVLGEEFSTLIRGGSEIVGSSLITRRLLAGFAGGDKEGSGFGRTRGEGDRGGLIGILLLERSAILSCETQDSPSALKDGEYGCRGMSIKYRAETGKIRSADR